MWRTVWQILVVAAGSSLVAVSYKLFFMPHHLVSGGLGGLSLLLWQAFGWSTGLQILLYNIPILWWGQKYLGKKFLLLTIIGTLSLSGALSVIPVYGVINDDPMLNAIFGGITCGLGIGLAMRSGGSTGGLDVLVVALNRRFSLPMGDVMLTVNGLVVAMAGLNNDIKVVLYTLVSMFVTGKMVDIITAGTAKKTILVVTEKAEALAHRVNDEMVRGVTMVDAKGAYSGTDRSVLLCAVTRYELSQFKEIVNGVDPGAFLVVLNTDEVLGRFRNYNPLNRNARSSA